MNLDKIEDIRLEVGSHESFERGACIMELVSYVAGEPWSDHPQCTCPVLTSYAISLNDRLDTGDRQQLKGLLPKLIGTRDSKSRERSEYLVLQAITVLLPLLTEGLGLDEITSTLRQFKHGEWAKARDYIEASWAAIRTSSYADSAGATVDAADSVYDAVASASTSADDAAYAVAEAAAATLTAAAAASYAASADAADAEGNYAYASYAYAAFAAAAFAAATSTHIASYSRIVLWTGVKQAVASAAISALEHACDIK